MLFDIVFYISLLVFGIGVARRLGRWFIRDIGSGVAHISASRRALGAFKGTLVTVFSRNAWILLKTILVDIILQLRILKDDEDRILWMSHTLIFVGFLGLLLMHALGAIITAALFADYQPTLNPFLFLRNVFGVVVIGGLVLSIIRRISSKRVGLTSTGTDYVVIILLALIVISGFLLEASKINSYSVYQRMVEDYADVMDENELQALEAYWANKFGVASPKIRQPVSRELLDRGRLIHETSCAECHSCPKWAFISYPASRIMKYVAAPMYKGGIPRLLWYIHFLACFFGLAYLPFSKMFHILATPLSLLLAAIPEQGEPDPVNIVTRQMIELDGCKHGGTCHLGCPVRLKREERIDRIPQFSPNLDFVGERGWKDLGCRIYEPEA